VKTLASYSIKGGVGKTACSVNLAYAAAEAGNRTLLVDLDPQGASSFYFRIRPSQNVKPKGFFTKQSKIENAIRGSDYPRLDVLPANLHFRKFDQLLGSLHKARNRLRDALARSADQYDIVVLDCPPTIGLLSENVFMAADMIVVPVIPTTLSERTFEQLLTFFRKSGYPAQRIVAFFSMVQSNNRLHQETMRRMQSQYKRFLNTVIPQSTDIERMGTHREPVLCYAPSRPGSLAYRHLCEELLRKL